MSGQSTSSAPADAGIIVEQREGAVLRLVLSNPAARNALSPAMYAAGLDAINRASADPAIRGILLHGDGAMFCAGGNLNRLLGNREREPAVQAASIDRMHAWVQAIRACPKPVIAAVEGAAAGAGFSIALACDLIVASHEARFVMAYSKVGLSPDGGATASLAAALPPARAFAVLALAEPLRAEELQRAGLVHQIVEPGDAVASGLALAKKLADGPTRVYGRIKALLQQARQTPFAGQLDAERDAFLASLFDDDAGEGITAFLGKRKPAFSGGASAPPDTPREPHQ